MESSALVVGATGIVGNNLGRHLRERGWRVYGLVRRPPIDIPGLLPITADLLDPAPPPVPPCAICVLRMFSSVHG